MAKAIEIPVPQRITINDNPEEFWKISVPSDNDIFWSICLSLLFHPCPDHKHLENLCDHKEFTNNYLHCIERKFQITLVNPFEKKLFFFLFNDKLFTPMISRFRAVTGYDRDDLENASARSDDMKQKRNPSYESIVRAASQILKCEIQVYEQYQNSSIINRIFTFPNELQDWKTCCCAVVMVKNIGDQSERFSFALKQPIARELRKKALMHAFHSFFRATGQSYWPEDDVTAIYNLPDAETDLLISLLRHNRFDVVKELYKQPPHIFERLSTAGFIVDPMSTQCDNANGEAKPAFFYAVLSNDFELLSQLYSYVINSPEWSTIAKRKPDERSLKVFETLSSVLTQTKSQIEAFRCDPEQKKTHSHHIKLLCEINNFQYKFYGSLCEKFIEDYSEGKDRQKNTDSQTAFLSSISTYEKYFNGPDFAQCNDSYDFDIYKEYSNYFYYIDRLNAMKFFDHAIALRDSLAIEEDAFEKIESAFCRLFLFDECLAKETMFSDRSLHILKYLNRLQFKSKLQEFKQHLEETKEKVTHQDKELNSHHVTNENKESTSHQVTNEDKESKSHQVTNEDKESKSHQVTNEDKESKSHQVTKTKSNSGIDVLRSISQIKDEFLIRRLKHYLKLCNQLNLDTFTDQMNQLVIGRTLQVFGESLVLNPNIPPTLVKSLLVSAYPLKVLKDLQNIRDGFSDYGAKLVRARDNMEKTMNFKEVQTELRDLTNKLKNIECIQEYRIRKWLLDAILNLNINDCGNVSGNVSIDFLEAMQTAEEEIKILKAEFLKETQESWRKYEAHFENHAIQIRNCYTKEIKSCINVGTCTDLINLKLKCFKCLLQFLVSEFSDIPSNESFDTVNAEEFREIRNKLEGETFVLPEISEDEAKRKIKDSPEIIREFKQEAERNLEELESLTKRAFHMMDFCDTQSEGCSYDKEDETESFYPKIGIISRALNGQYFLSEDEKDQVYSSVDVKYKRHHDTIFKLISSLKAEERLQKKDLESEFVSILGTEENEKVDLQSKYLNCGAEIVIKQLNNIKDWYGKLLTAIEENELDSKLCDKICEELGLSKEIKRILMKINSEFLENAENHKGSFLHFLNKRVFVLKEIVEDVNFDEKFFIVKNPSSTIIMYIYLGIINKGIEDRIEKIGDNAYNAIISSNILVKFLSNSSEKTGFQEQIFKEHKVLFSFRRELHVQAAVELLFLDCANVMSLKKKEFEDLLNKAERLFSGINVRNFIAHGNPLLEAICSVLEPHDLSTEIIQKVLEIVSDYEAIEVMSNLLNKINEYHSNFLGTMEKKDSNEIQNFRRKAKLCIRWKDYAALI